VYYDGGSVVDNTTHALNDLPVFGVIAINEQDDTYNRNTLHNADYYLRHVDGYWLPLDWMGFVDHCLHKRDMIEALLVGRYIGNDAYNQIMTTVTNDADFLPPTRSRGRFER